MTHQDIQEAEALRFYKAYRSNDPISIRGALADAAHMCDAVANDILDEHTGPGRKRPRRRGLDIAAAMKRAGDAIWKLREKVQVTDSTDEKIS